LISGAAVPKITAKVGGSSLDRVGGIYGAEMGALTSFLQQEFARQCPSGWRVRAEGRLLPRTLERLLGYSARADVVLEKLDDSLRLWIEFEVSRADPVANHAKFATSHLFQPQQPTDRFLAMVSPHVTRSRRNLAFNAVALMRQVGTRAYQTVLFPYMAPADVQRLNQLEVPALSAQDLDIGREVERALAVTEPLIAMTDYDIHLAGDMLAVMLNLRQWNEDMATEGAKRLWGSRTVTYFVYDEESGLFAPSKFCAYTAVPTRPPVPDTCHKGAGLGMMTVAVYSELNDGSHLLDGHRAQRHLTTGLGMIAVESQDAPAVDKAFSLWREHHADAVVVHPAGPVFLLSPHWFK
jgi:hypothetical protein